MHNLHFGTIVQAGLDSSARLYRCTKLCNTVYYAVLLMMNDWTRSKHVKETNSYGIKIEYKNCASRWSLTS